jgi:type IV secretion system protein VirD4
VDLIHVLLLYLVATKGSGATLPDMRRLLTQPEEMFLDTIKTMVLMQELPFIAQPAARFHDVGREIKSVISTAITQTFFLDDPNIARVLGGSDFSMMGLKEKATTVFLILPGRYLNAYSRFFRLAVTSAIDQLTARPGGHPTLFILDEFATLQNLGAVSKAFGFAAGYRLQLWPFLQDLPQLQAIYGDKWESFLANAGLVQFFAPSDMTTAEYLLKRGGQYTTKQINESFSTLPDARASSSLAFSDTRVALLPCETTMSMPADIQVVFFGGVHGPSVVKRWNYFENRRLAGLYDNDPFHN